MRLLVFRDTSSGGSSGSTGGQGEVRALEMVEMVVPMASIPLVRMLPTEEQVPGGGGRAQRVGNSSSSYSKAGNGGDGIVIIEW